MNIFLTYQEKILNSLEFLEKKKIIKIPKDLKGIIVELPPKNEKAVISCKKGIENTSNFMLYISTAPLLGTAKSGGPLNDEPLAPGGSCRGGGELLFLPLLVDYITECTVDGFTHFCYILPILPIHISILKK